MSKTSDAMVPFARHLSCGAILRGEQVVNRHVRFLIYARSQRHRQALSVVSVCARISFSRLAIQCILDDRWRMLSEIFS